MLHFIIERWLNRPQMSRAASEQILLFINILKY